MPTQGIAESECTLSQQNQEHVASNIDSALVYFNGLDTVVFGHIWADFGTQAVYILVFNNYYLLSHTHTHTHTHTRARVRAHQADDNRNRELHEVCVSHCCIDHTFQGNTFHY